MGRRCQENGAGRWCRAVVPRCRGTAISLPELLAQWRWSVRERSCRKGVESDKAAVRTAAPAKKRCHSCCACKRRFALSIFSFLCVGDGSIDRHRYDALAYCMGLLGLCLPCILHSGSSCGEQVQPLVVKQHAAGCHTESDGNSGACRPHCFHGRPCWEGRRRGRAGCLRVERQGALPQQHQVPALFALIVIFPKTYKSRVLFYFSLIVIYALGKKNGFVPPQVRSSLGCTLPSSPWPVQPRQEGQR